MDHSFADIKNYNLYLIDHNRDIRDVLDVWQTDRRLLVAEINNSLSQPPFGFAIHRILLSLHLTLRPCIIRLTED